MKSLIISLEAEMDLNDIWEYIAADSADAADRFLEKLYDQMLLLAKMPGMGHVRKDLAESRSILFWPVGNYIILYRCKADCVEIAAIAHGKRDIPSFIRRRGIP